MNTKVAPVGLGTPVRVIRDGRLVSLAEFYACDAKNVLAARMGARRLMSWPATADDVRSLCRSVTSLGCSGVTSVGCGTGVVEWLLFLSTSLTAE